MTTSHNLINSNICLICSNLILAGPNHHINLESDQFWFQRIGDYWIVAFMRKAILLQHGVALDYIAYMLARPNENIPAIHVSNLGDMDGLEELRKKHKRYQQMTHEQLEREGLSNPYEALRLNKKAKDAVAKAIYRFLKVLDGDAYLPELARHFKNALLPIKQELCYQPSPPIDWQL